MSSKQWIKHLDEILASDNHFRALAMELPTVDALDRPLWNHDSEDVLRAYRKLARYCHPDKIACLDEEEDKEKAERAYQLLEKAKACLVNELTRGPYVRQYLKDNPPRKATFVEGDDLVEAAHARQQEHEKERKGREELRDKEGRDMSNSVAREMEKKRKLAELARLEKERKLRKDDSDDSDEARERFKSKAPVVQKKENSDSDEDAAREQRRKRNAGRGGRRFGI